MADRRFFINDLPDYVRGTDVEATIVSARGVLGQRLLLLVREIRAHAKHQQDFSVYVGNAGLAYTYLRLCTSPSVRAVLPAVCDLLQDARACADRAVQNVARYEGDIEDTGPSILLGHGGVYIVCALVESAVGGSNTTHWVQKYTELAEYAAQPDFEADEFLYGRVGYIFGALMLNTHFGREVVPSSAIGKVVEAVFVSGLNYSERYKHPCPLMYAWPARRPSEYVGAAHGTMGIVYVLLLGTSQWHARSEWRDAVIGSLDYILSLEGAGNSGPGHYPTCTDHPKALVHWCHGAPGAVYVFAQAAEVLGDSKYLDAAVRAGEVVWREGLLKKGPGLCHGVAGNAYALLRLHKATGDKKWLHRAHQFANFMDTPEFQQGAREPDHPYSLFEGWAGAVLLLADLFDPATAAFPFFELPLPGRT